MKHILQSLFVLSSAICAVLSMSCREVPPASPSPYVDISQNAKHEFIAAVEERYTSAGGSLLDTEWERREELIKSYYYCALNGAEKAQEDLRNNLRGFMTYKLNTTEKSFVSCLITNGAIDRHYVRSNDASNPCDRFYIYGYNSVMKRHVNENKLEKCRAVSEIKTIHGAYLVFRPWLFSPKDAWLSE